jgi:protein TonB
MAPNAELFFEHDPWSRNLAWSAGLHLAAIAVILAYTLVAPNGSGSTWGAGGQGEAMGVTLVNSIPLPSAPTQTENVLANESKGLATSLPKPVEKEPSAIEIPDQDAKKVLPPKPVATPTHEKPRPPVPAEDNLIPYGEGGPISGPYGSFNAGGAKGGFGFTGGGGDFGTQFAWYVRVIQQKVSANWMKYEIDPRVSQSQRVYLTFDITRAGQPTNVRVEQSSGIASLDRSAIQALERIDTFGPLPSGYSGNKVSVEFWFDYKR